MSNVHCPNVHFVIANKRQEEIRQQIKFELFQNKLYDEARMSREIIETTWHGHPTLDVSSQLPFGFATIEPLLELAKKHHTFVSIFAEQDKVIFRFFGFGERKV